MIRTILWQVRNNLVIQFSLTSFVVMFAGAIFLSTMLSTGLNQNLDHIEEHGQAMMSGAMIKPSDPISIPSITSDFGRLLKRRFAGRFSTRMRMTSPTTFA